MTYVFSTAWRRTVSKLKLDTMVGAMIFNIPYGIQPLIYGLINAGNEVKWRIVRELR